METFTVMTVLEFTLRALKICVCELYKSNCYTE